MCVCVCVCVEGRGDGSRWYSCYRAWSARGRTLEKSWDMLLTFVELSASAAAVLRSAFQRISCSLEYCSQTFFRPSVSTDENINVKVLSWRGGHDTVMIKKVYSLNKKG